MKRPSFQFYPGDWLHDTALRACSLAARGLWMDMLAFMHQGKAYGHLTLSRECGTNDTLTPILPRILARMVGDNPEEVEQLLGELESAGVFSRTSEGIIFSRRMVQDEKVREARATGGIQSLNHPNVPRPKDPKKDTLGGSLPGSLPSSIGGSPSSSSSPSSKNLISEPEIGADGEMSLTQRKQPLLPSERACQLAALLKTEILRNKADYRITQKQERKWSITAQRMLDIERRSYEQIAKVIRWAQRDEFWRSNVLSMDSLRKKFDQLEMKAKRTGLGNANPTTLPPEYVSASEKIRQQRSAEEVQ